MEKKTILAVDDNPVNLAAIERALRDEYEVVPMAAAKRALRFLRVNSADLVLLDVMMPEMDGVEALAEMRKLPNGEKAPVAFLTGTRDEDAEARGRALGIVDYITKPFQDAALKERVRAIIG